MLGPTYLAFIRYFYRACLTRSPDFLSRFRNMAGATHKIKIKIDKIESQVAPAEEAAPTLNLNVLQHKKPTRSINTRCFNKMYPNFERPRALISLLIVWVKYIAI